MRQCVLLLTSSLLLIATVCAGSDAVAWIDAPVDISDGQAVRIDIRSASILDHPVVKSVIACSAVDRPFIPYEERAANRTGCRSPGFTSLEIFSDKMEREKGSLATKFAVRRSGQSLYIRKRLVDPHTPIVYVEVHGSLKRNSDGHKVDWTWASRYEMLSRYYPLGMARGSVQPVVAQDPETVKDNAAAAAAAQTPPQSLIDRLKNTSYAIALKIRDKVSGILNMGMESKTYDDDYSAEEKDKRNKFMGLHWSVYSGSLAGFVLFALCIVCYVVYAVFLKTSSSSGNAETMSRAWKRTYTERRKEEDRTQIRGWFQSASLMGVFSSTAKEEKHIV